MSTGDPQERQQGVCFEAREDQQDVQEGDRRRSKRDPLLGFYPPQEHRRVLGGLFGE